MRVDLRPTSGLPLASARGLLAALLSAGYLLALSQGRLGLPALAVFAALATLALLAGYPQAQVRRAAHGLFLLLGVALAAHRLPGFSSAQPFNAEVLSPGALPFSMALNLDKPLIGFWLLLACPWAAPGVAWRQALRTCLWLLPLTSGLVLLIAWLAGLVAWAPKWPPNGWWWLANNLLLVCVVEELLFRGYLQGALERAAAPWLALGISSVLFGLAHIGLGGLWVLLAALAGVGYGLARQRGGLLAAVGVHFGVNLAHFGLFSYPALASG